MTTSTRRRRLLSALAGTGIIAAAGLAAAPPASSLPGFFPTAVITADPNPALVGQVVTFDGSDSTDDGFGGAITKYEWDLDGNSSDFEVDTSTTPTASRSYSSPGPITARLRVTDADGEIDVDTVMLDVQPNLPTASFTFSPPTPLSLEAVNFDGSGSTPPAGESIAAHVWDLDGDGEFDDATGPTPAFGYPTPGPRTVSLRVDASGGGSDVTSRVVPVGNRAPAASFGFNPDAPRAGKPVKLFSTSSDPDGALASQAWDLDGDGEFDDASGPTAQQTFAGGGTFTVGLKVVDTQGAESVVTAPIEVGAETLELLSPFPVVRLAGELRSNGNTLVELLSVRGPKGSDVSVRCRGKSCPFGKQDRAIKKHRVSFPGLERPLAPGTLLKVFVTDRDSVGKFTRFKLRRDKAPKRTDRCLKGNSTKPIPCPR